MKNVLPALTLIVAASLSLLAHAGDYQVPARQTQTCWTEQVSKPELITWDGHRIPQVDSVRRCQTTYSPVRAPQVPGRYERRVRVVAPQEWHEIDVDELIRQREDAELKQEQPSEPSRR